jgi:hypothetical protein
MGREPGPIMDGHLVGERVVQRLGDVLHAVNWHLMRVLHSAAAATTHVYDPTGQQQLVCQHVCPVTCGSVPTSASVCLHAWPPFAGSP